MIEYTKEALSAISPTTLPALRRTPVLATLLVALIASPTLAATESDLGNFDARAIPTTPTWPDTDQLEAVAELRQQMRKATVRYDERSGATKVVWNPGGYLTEPLPGATTRDAAVRYLGDRLDLLGLSQNDWVEHELQTEFVNRTTGATRIYLTQHFESLPVYNAILQANINRDGRLISVNNTFMPRLDRAIEHPRIEIGLDEAVLAFAAHLGTPSLVEMIEADPSPLRPESRVVAPSLAKKPIGGRRAWLPIDRGRVRMVWNFQVEVLDRTHYYDVNVDIETGKVWTRFDWVDRDQYRVYPQPVESPIHTTPVPPADGRVLLVNPQDPSASPLGWHDDGTTNFTTLRGNNVHAYEDTNNLDAPPPIETDCGVALECDFEIDLSGEPIGYQDASLVNLFYWNNIVHDVQYQYGFDEPAGNFQVDNFGLGGIGNDAVNAEGQDGRQDNNAFFATPPDGEEPRMEMHLFSKFPQLDSALDNGIVVHEYGHGVSNRQVGGPANTSCLEANQQMGEGWSDWLALVYTATETDTGAQGRGLGTYVLRQGPGGPGIRTQRYSTDNEINDWTFETITEGVSIPHGVGAVWAQSLWELYWDLVDEHGFSTDLEDAMGGAGNQRAMLYVNEGMQNTTCDPTFLDARDAVLQAVQDNFGGEDYCRAWTSFARFGLGESATTGGPGSLDATNDFSVPAECGGCDLSLDADCDGISNAGDNCLNVPNPDQRDSNNDQFGNVCDPDMDNNQIVNFLDVAIFRDAFLTTDEDADFNGDGIVNFLDLATLRDFFLLPPGPTGITIPCGACQACFSCNWVPEFTATLQPTGLIQVAFTNVLDPDRVIISLQVRINGGPWDYATFNVDQTFNYDPPFPGNYEFRAEGFETQFPEPCDTDCSDVSPVVVVP